MGGRVKTVVDREGTMVGMPEVVSALEDAVDEATESLRWVGSGDSRMERIILDPPVNALGTVRIPEADGVGTIAATVAQLGAGKVSEVHVEKKAGLGAKP